jgi:hypothetical protein
VIGRTPPLLADSALVTYLVPMIYQPSPDFADSSPFRAKSDGLVSEPRHFIIAIVAPSSSQEADAEGALVCGKLITYMMLHLAHRWEIENGMECCCLRMNVVGTARGTCPVPK